MTSLWGHDTQIALRQAGKTGVTITLVETFIYLPPTMDAFNLMQIFDRNFFAQPVI